ncbi:hypothetical protein ACFY84_32395 [Streptomyces sp. NPDC012438]|uniref:hypothetical protein n=1 Tax=Streptomyces sp. NPDC012438 TaxID=3364833 RepID=UPI0036E89A1A
MVRLEWTPSAERAEVEFGTSRTGAVRVPLHRIVSVDSLAGTHPEAGGEEFRQIGEGRRPPPAALRPKAEAKAVSEPAWRPGRRERRPPGETVAGSSRG